MNYQKHYNLLIERAKHRQLKCYCESHHILPICVGGKGTEEVLLTPEEHYLAHQLLVKIHPNNNKLVYALNMMTVSSNTVIRSNKSYGWIRRKYSNLMIGNKRGLGNKNVKGKTWRWSKNKDRPEKILKKRSGSIWITNGISNKWINKTDPIPSGYWRGRKFSEKMAKAALENARIGRKVRTGK